MSTPQSENLRGALFMTLSMGGFALNDALMKQVLTSLPLFPAMAIRGGMMTVALVILCIATGAIRWRPQRRDARLIGWRAFAELASTLAFLTALANMPIASATAILQSAPLAVTLAAFLFLSEPIGWRRGLALVIGFLGVMIIIRPGTAEFNVYALFAVGTVLFIVLRDLATRQMSRGVPSLMVALATALALTAAGTAGSFVQDWQMPGARVLLMILVASGFLIVGYVFAVRTMQTGDVAFVAPFRYTILLFAMVLGILFFDEIPDAITLAGAALVVGTGLFTFWREQRVARRELAVQAAQVRTR